MFFNFVNKIHMRLLLCTFAIIIFLSSCFEEERSCKPFKVGHFKSEITIEDSVYISTFSRTEKLQIEYFKGQIDSAKVRWINDCEVIFKTLRPKNRFEKKDIHLKILTTTDSSYTFEYSYVGETNKQKGIAYRIKN